MADALSDDRARELATRLDSLLERLEDIPGPGVDTAMAAIETLTALYGAALARIVAAVRAGASVDALADDELVGHLLALHGLHPRPPDERISAALAEAGAQLGERGEASLTGIDDGVAHITVTAGGCQSSAGTLAAALANVVLEAAPELAGVEPVTSRPPAAPALIPVESLLHGPPR